MDGPISTYEAAGPAQRAAYAPFRGPSVGPPEKVPPVSEGERSRSSVRNETGPPDNTNRNPAARDRTAELGRPEKTQAPPYCLEPGYVVAEETGTGIQTGSSQDPPPSPLQPGMGKGPETLPLPGDSPGSSRHEALAEALADAKARWAEINKDVLEANALPDQSLPDPTGESAPAEGRDITDTRRTSSTRDAGFSSKTPDPTALAGKDSPGVEQSDVLHHRLASRYESLAASLSSPHPTQPLIDLFV